MIVQFLCRRQCLILILTVGVLIMFGTYVFEKFSGPSLKGTATQRLIKLHQRQATARQEDGPDIVVDNDGENEGDSKNNDGDNVAIPVARVIVDGPRSIQREKSVLGGVGCKMTLIDPFDKEIVAKMHDFGQHKCHYDKGVRFDVSNGNLDVNLSDVNFLQTRNIVDDAKNGSAFGDFKYLVKPELALLQLSPGLYRFSSCSLFNRFSQLFVVKS